MKLTKTKKKVLKMLKIFKKITNQKFVFGDYKHHKKLHLYVFIAQSMGVEFGYSFNWHREHPYCCELTKDIFEVFI